MKQERFSEEKIIGILREAEKGERPIADLYREHGIAEQTFYRWRRKYGGLNTSDVQRLKEPTTENARLKRLLAERGPGGGRAQGAARKKMVSTELRRAAVSFLQERGLSERRSCVLVGLSRSGFRYQEHPRDDGDVAERLREIARRHKRYGYRRALALLRRDHLKVNHKRVRRLWKQIGLQCPVRRKRRRSQHPGSMPQEATRPNHVWTYDFVSDTTSDSRTLKFLTLVDEFTRECVAIKVERRLPAEAVIEVLEQVFSQRGVPEYLRSDNPQGAFGSGPEFIAKAIQTWLTQRQVKTHYIEPGSPWQNAYGESFNGKFRDECLNMEVFHSVAETTAIVEGWRRSYNHERPHSSLGYQTPAEFAAGWQLRCKPDVECEVDAWMP